MPLHSRKDKVSSRQEICFSVLHIHLLSVACNYFFVFRKKRESQPADFQPLAVENGWPTKKARRTRSVQHGTEEREVVQTESVFDVVQTEAVLDDVVQTDSVLDVVVQQN